MVMANRYQGEIRDDVIGVPPREPARLNVPYGSH
jgi:hypothetical protein